MITKTQIKVIAGLDLKKNRDELQLFKVEGRKMVLELLENEYSDVDVFATHAFIEQEAEVIKSIKTTVTPIAEKDMERLSTMKTPPGILAVAGIKTSQILKMDGLCLILDGIKDPGNLGTIIRTADWFGVDSIFCLNDCVDWYNPKVLQSAMGSAFRMNFQYLNFTDLKAQAHNAEIPIVGTFLDGHDIREITLRTNHAALVFGNESHGISADVASLCNQRVKIPAFGKAESLNAAVSSAVILGYLKLFNG